MGHKGPALEQLIFALEHVKPKRYKVPPEDWSVISRYIDKAKNSSGYNAANHKAEKLIKDIHSEYLRIKGQNQVNQLMSYAIKNAQAGKLKVLVDIPIEKAKEYANKTGAQIDLELVLEIYQTYRINIVKKGPVEAEKLRRDAANLEKQGYQENAKSASSLAGQYEREVIEAGLINDLGNCLPRINLANKFL